MIVADQLEYSRGEVGNFDPVVGVHDITDLAVQDHRFLVGLIVQGSQSLSWGVFHWRPL